MKLFDGCYIFATDWQNSLFLLSADKINDFLRWKFFDHLTNFENFFRDHWTNFVFLSWLFDELCMFYRVYLTNFVIFPQDSLTKFVIFFTSRFFIAITLRISIIYPIGIHLRNFAGFLLAFGDFLDAFLDVILTKIVKFFYDYKTAIFLRDWR